MKRHLCAFMVGIFYVQSAFCGSAVTIRNVQQSYMNCGNANDLNDLNKATFMFWLNPTTALVNNFLFIKGNVGSSAIIQNTANKSLSLRRDMSTTDVLYISPSGYVIPNLNLFLAWTVDIGAAATQKFLFYQGFSTAPAVLVSGTVSSEGVGNYLTDSAVVFKIGNASDVGTPSIGMDIQKAMISTGVFTLAQIQDQQFTPHVTTNTLAYWNFSNSVSSPTYYDLTGRGNNCTSVGTNDTIASGDLTFQQRTP